MNLCLSWDTQWWTDLPEMSKKTLTSQNKQQTDKQTPPKTFCTSNQTKHVPNRTKPRPQPQSNSSIQIPGEFVSLFRGSAPWAPWLCNNHPPNFLFCLLSFFFPLMVTRSWKHWTDVSIWSLCFWDFLRLCHWQQNCKAELTQPPPSLVSSVTAHCLRSTGWRDLQSIVEWTGRVGPEAD